MSHSKGRPFSHNTPLHKRLVINIFRYSEMTFQSEKLFITTGYYRFNYRGSCKGSFFDLWKVNYPPL